MGEDGDAYCAKDNIPRGKDTTIRAETFVALVVQTIAKKCAGNGVALKLVFVVKPEIRITNITKYLQLGVSWFCAEKQFKWGYVFPNQGG